MSRAALLGGLVFLALAPLPARALDFRSIAEAGTVMYDAPSQKARPLFVAARGTPVEVVVSTEAWIKVRDAAGDIAWVEKRALADKRMLIVLGTGAEVRKEADAAAALVFEADKDVLLEWLEAGPAGWVRVRHADGQSGFVRVNQVWGL